MQASTYQRIRELSRMTVKELRATYREVFGEPSRSHHKELLRKRIAWRLQALDEGELPERARRRAEQLANDADLRLRAPRKPGAGGACADSGRSCGALARPAAAAAGDAAEPHVSGPRPGGRGARGRLRVRGTPLPVAVGHCPGDHRQPLERLRVLRAQVNETGAVRCAVYTRKSTTEGLEQEFNSLDAQRESAQAYIASQRHEGWVCLPSGYDDGGCSGGSIQRPALQQLLADIEAGTVDCVVVYKVDRLSRSLLDFARIIERFQRHGVSLVSVTQQFNTTSSMGRLTLNVLLSFAQFEREIISERTRDKMAAARRKGRRLGGVPVLGYDVQPTDKQLVGVSQLPV